MSKPACSRSSAWAANSDYPIPAMVSGTIEAMGTMLAGQTADAFYTSLSHARSAVRRPELRHRPRVHDRSHPVDS